MKPEAGAYRQLLIDNLSDKMLATAFATRQLSLGITASFVGNVVTKPDLADQVKDCLRGMPDNPAAQYYLAEMEAGRVQVVITVTPTSTPDRVYRSGELYFTS